MRVRMLIVLWIAIILFSSTSLAGRLSDNAFLSVAAMFPDWVRQDHAVLEDVYFTAEKTFHFSLFFVLGMLLWNTISGSSRRFIRVVLAGLVVGISSEALQMFFPARDPTIRDIFINVLGAAAGASFALMLTKAGARA